MRFPVEPYAGAGSVRLGMTIEDIQAALGQRAIMADQGGENPIATFPDIGVHAEIAADGHCSAIEFMAPAAPELNDHPLLGLPFAEVRNYLAAIDPGLEEDGSGLTAERVGVGLYAPMATDDPQRPAEGVIVFERGYYQEHG